MKPEIKAYIECAFVVKSECCEIEAAFNYMNGVLDTLHMMKRITDSEFEKAFSDLVDWRMGKLFP